VLQGESKAFFADTPRKHHRRITFSDIRPFMILISGFSPAQLTYFNAQAKPRSCWHVCERVSDVDSTTRETKFLRDPRVLLACLRRTSLGLFWEPGHTGGTDYYLCHDDREALKHFITEQINEMNCITTYEETTAAYMLRIARQKKTIRLLESIGCHERAAQMWRETIAEPDPNWINTFCAGSQISIRARQTIQPARYVRCNTNSIRTFFEKFAGLFNCSPYLIFDCDETHISSRKRFKVLTIAGKFPFTPFRERLSHFSAMCTVSAQSYKF
jgi:hypothetical protein